MKIVFPFTFLPSGQSYGMQLQARIVSTVPCFLPLLCFLHGLHQNSFFADPRPLSSSVLIRISCRCPPPPPPSCADSHFETQPRFFSSMRHYYPLPTPFVLSFLSRRKFKLLLSVLRLIAFLFRVPFFASDAPGKTVLNGFLSLRPSTFLLGQNVRYLSRPPSPPYQRFSLPAAWWHHSTLLSK